MAFLVTAAWLLAAIPSAVGDAVAPPCHEPPPATFGVGVYGEAVPSTKKCQRPVIDDLKTKGEVRAQVKVS